MHFARGLLVALELIALCACGTRSLGPAPASEQFASVNVSFKTASQTMRGLGVSAYADGMRSPNAPHKVVDISGSACAAGDAGSRTCTFDITARVGLDDFTFTVYDRSPVNGKPAGKVVASGTILRQGIALEHNAFGVTTAGPVASLAISPRVLVAAADGTPQDVPFAILPVDAGGFYVLGAPPPAAHVSVDGDPMHTLAIDGPQNTSAEFVAHYDGAPAGDVKLRARASALRSGSADFAPLVVSPSSLNLAPAQTATIFVSQSLVTGAFGARVTHGGCTVAPASLAPARAGGAVTFGVTSNGSGACTVSIAGSSDVIPITVPVPIIYGLGTLGLGIGPSKIQHVVFMIQENRSFDNLFGGLDSNGKPFPGADTVSNPNPGEPTPHNHKGKKVKMKIGKLEACYDLLHYHANSVTDVNGGQMNGFDLDAARQELCTKATPPPDYAYRTMEYSEVQPYWLMGEQYAVSDRMFEPLSSASFGPHLWAVAGQSDLAIDNPVATQWGCDAASGGTVAIYNGKGQEFQGPFPCFSMQTLADLLDSRGVSWRWYATDMTDFGYRWNAYDAINQIRNGPDWTSHVVTPPAQIISDVGGGTLQAMTWVTPTNATSDHAQDHSKLGPGWVTSVVNEIGESKFWDSTAIFIMWDDWGGWYDHVPPPVVGPVQTGIRVGFIAISPYVKAGYVSHVVHTSGSVLHFTEEALNLPSLGQEDAREDDLSDMFDFSQQPLKFSPFVVKNKQEVLRAATFGSLDPSGISNAGD